MLLSDNETKFDMLNNRAIAKTVLKLVNDSKDSPISIGIHGDWGAGKSSILEMIEDEITIQEKKRECSVAIKCIRFNGWRYQGLEDSKSALMGAIITELEKDQSLKTKAKEIFKKLWKNINWITAAKEAGKFAFSFASGLAPIAMLTSVLDNMKGGASDSSKDESSAKAVNEYLNTSNIFEDTSCNREFEEFQTNFSELLEKAEIDKLVVLIDDLDRCLPAVAIEVLEAMRLFMFNNKTAFVIAADESMIKYAVKKHFPNIMLEPDTSVVGTDYGFSDKYLEKLIQVPFRIPTLGMIESRIYIMLLLIESKIDEGSENYLSLVDKAVEKLQQPWNVQDFTFAELSAILKDSFKDVEEEVKIAIQIRDILAKNTFGNPRKIKRFINMLLLRYQISEARGFGNSIEMAKLAKMMLAEYYFNDFYKLLAKHLDDNGVCQEMIDYISKQEIAEVKTENTNKGPKETKKKSNTNKEDEAIKDKDDDWFGREAPNNWVTMDPKLIDTDLRPYFFACKENEDYFFTNSADDRIREVVVILMATEMAIANRKEDVDKLTLEEANRVMDLLIDKIISQNSWKNKPQGIAGIRTLVGSHPELRGKLIEFINNIDPTKVGGWVTTGWSECIPTTSNEYVGLERYFEKLKMTEGVSKTVIAMIPEKGQI